MVLFVFVVVPSIVTPTLVAVKGAEVAVVLQVPRVVFLVVVGVCVVEAQQSRYQ